MATCKDHLGKEYKSISAMCKAYGITYDAYYKRKSYNWSLEEILTRPIQKKNPVPKGMTKYESDKRYFVKDYQKRYKDKNGCYHDHLDNKFRTLDDLCAAYGIDGDKFAGRMRRNWSLERALTEGTNPKEHIVGTAFMILGEYFPSNAKVGERFGFEESIISAHADNLEEWLLTRVVIEFEGKTYGTLTSLCAAYNICENTVMSRIRRKWTLHDAITTPVKNINNGHPTTDHYGNEFVSKSSMLGYYGISHHAYNLRIAKGWSQKDALETPVRRKQQNNCLGNKSLVKSVKEEKR